MAKGARSKTRKRNNAEKRKKLEKSEILRNERIAAKCEEIRKMKIDSQVLSKDMTVEIPFSKITIKIHDEATNETQEMDTIKEGVPTPISPATDETNINQDAEELPRPVFGQQALRAAGQQWQQGGDEGRQGQGPADCEAGHQDCQAGCQEGSGANRRPQDRQVAFGLVGP
jgi:hypothetical protein